MKLLKKLIKLFTSCCCGGEKPAKPQPELRESSVDPEPTTSSTLSAAAEVKTPPQPEVQESKSSVPNQPAPPQPEVQESKSSAPNQPAPPQPEESKSSAPNQPAPPQPEVQESKSSAPNQPVPPQPEVQESKSSAPNQPAPPQPEVQESKSSAPNQPAPPQPEVQESKSSAPNLPAPPQPEVQYTTSAGSTKLEPPVPAQLEESHPTAYAIPASSAKCVFSFTHPKLVLEPEDFELKVFQQKVLLSSCIYSARIVMGTIAVANMEVHHTVMVRCTTNNWDTYSDVEAVPGERTSDGNSFAFEVDMEGKQSLHFAIRLRLHPSNDNIREFWDNNETKNYSLILQ